MDSHEGRPSVAALYRNIWRFAAGVRLRFAAALTLMGGSQVAKLAVPWAAGQAINVLQQGGPAALPIAGGWIALVIGIHAFGWMLHGPGRVMERSVGMQVRRGLADALYEKLAAVPIAWHDRRHSGDTQLRVNQASRALFDFAQNQFVYLQSGINFVGPVLALSLMNRNVGLVALLGYVMVALIIVRFDRAMMRLAEQENLAERRYASASLDLLSNVATITSLRLHSSLRRLLDTRLAAVFEPLKRAILVNEAKWCSVDLLSVTLTWSLVALYVWQQRDSSETVLLGSVFMIYQYAQQAGGVVTAVASNFQNLARARADFASATPIWRAPRRRGNGEPISSDWQSIELRGVGFDHQEALAQADGEPPSEPSRRRMRRQHRKPARTATATPALASASAPGSASGTSSAAATPSPDTRSARIEQINLSLDRGSRIALVGESGSGKSTLLRVLAGLYPIHEGLIVVDGQAAPSLHHLASISTLIPQDAEAFEATVRENLSFDLPVEEGKIRLAIDVAGFDTVLQGLPQGLDTPISERGANLSGGQRQRLGLARGVLAAFGSSLLLLDEPTSALDPITETLVFERISAAFPDACIISAVHRMGLLRYFDQVVLMEAGRILDQGSVDEVAARQPALKRMIQAQAKPGG